MSMIGKKHENTPKNTKKQQPTENQKNAKYKNVSSRVPDFCI